MLTELYEDVTNGVEKMKKNKTTLTTENVRSSTKRTAFGNVNFSEMNGKLENMKKGQDTTITKQVVTVKDEKPFDVDQTVTGKENVAKKENKKKTGVNGKNISDKTSVVSETRITSQKMNRKSSQTSQNTFEGNNIKNRKKISAGRKSLTKRENKVTTDNLLLKTVPEETQDEKVIVGNNEKEIGNNIISTNSLVITNTLEHADVVEVVTSTPMLTLNKKADVDVKIVSPPLISPIKGKTETGDYVPDVDNEREKKEEYCHEECDRRASYNTSGEVDSSEHIIERTYIMDNLEHLQQREKTIPDPNYLKNHPVIDNRKRSILVDWLIEVADRMSCSQETIFLAVSYIDFFLSQASIKVQELQLLGVTALLIACKYEERRGEFLGVNGCIFVTNNMYTKAQFYEMEIRILTILRFDVGMPTTSTFMDIFSCLCTIEGEEMAAARYIAELSLFQGDGILGFLPSIQAASALLLGSCLVDEVDTAELELSKPFGFSLDELKPCMDEMLELCRKATKMKLRAVMVKYSVKRFHCVSQTIIIS